ncbi:MAG: hypothetical protein ABIJ92_00980 [Candidatus Aenigmatarchaeota archaeon]
MAKAKKTKRKITKKVSKPRVTKKQANRHYYFISLLVLIVVIIIIFSGQPTDTQTEKPTICNPPYIADGISCCLDDNSNGVCDAIEPMTNDNVIAPSELVILEANSVRIDTDRFKWILDHQIGCRNCMSNPNLFSCDTEVQNLYFNCDIPEGYGELYCTATTNGNVYQKVVVRSCSETDITGNYIPVNPIQTNTVSVCCKLTYTKNGEQKETNEVCDSAIIQPACQLN